MYFASSIVMSYLDLPACSGLALQISFTPELILSIYVIWYAYLFVVVVLNTTDFGQFKYTLKINIF